MRTWPPCQKWRGLLVLKQSSTLSSSVAASNCPEEFPAASKIETGPRIFIICCSQLFKKSSGILVYFSYHHAGQLSKIYAPSKLRAVSFNRQCECIANEGPVRIQYKCLVPIYIFPEMKLLFPKQNYNVLSPNSHRAVCIFCLLCGLILGKYKSLTDTWMWKLGLRPRNSQKWKHKWDFCCSVYGVPLPPSAVMSLLRWPFLLLQNIALYSLPLWGFGPHIYSFWVGVLQYYQHPVGP